MLANIIVFHVPYGIIWLSSPDTAKCSLIFSLCYVACSIAAAFTTIIWFIATVIVSGGEIKQFGRKVEPVIQVILLLSSILNGNAFSLLRVLPIPVDSIRDTVGTTQFASTFFKKASVWKLRVLRRVFESYFKNSLYSNERLRNSQKNTIVELRYT